MKAEIRLSGLFLAAFAALLLASLETTAAETAESPRAELARLTVELSRQSCSVNSVARKDVIRIAQGLQPPPAPPEEAERAMARGRVQMRTATVAADYGTAAEEFCGALKQAPWWPDAYFNLATALEKAGQFWDAHAALSLYLFALPQAPDARAVKEHIYELEAMAQRLDRARMFLDWFKTKYGATRIRTAFICNYATRCTEAEAAQDKNWTQLWPPGSGTKGDPLAAWSRANRYLRFELKGEEIRFEGAGDTFCGRVPPKSDQAADVEWRLCDDGTPAKIKLRSSKSTGGPAVESAWHCLSGSDSCDREWVLLE